MIIELKNVICLNVLTQVDMHKKYSSTGMFQIMNYHIYIKYIFVAHSDLMHQ